MSLYFAFALLPTMQSLDRFTQDSLNAGDSSGSSAGDALFSSAIYYTFGSSASYSNTNLVAAGILFAMTLVYGALSYGVWKMSETARKFAVVWLALALMLALAGVVTADSGASLIWLVGASLSAASIVYLLRPEVRAAFGARWSPVRRP
jgi:hypothetical protein